LKNTTIKAIQEHSRLPFASNSPFEVHVNTGVDASKTKAFYVETNIVYGEQIFKKRMSAILKEEKYLLVYEFKQENAGSFLKPIYKTIIQMDMTRQLFSTSEAIILDTLTLGLVDTHLAKEVIKVKSIKKRRDYFKTEIQSKLFAEKIQSILKGFLSKHYDEYEKLKQIK